jgi:hypothetical protein
MGEEKKTPLECAVTLMAQIAEERDFYKKQWLESDTKNYEMKKQLEALRRGEEVSR